MNSSAKVDKLAYGSILLAHTSVDMQTISLATLLPTLLTTFNLDYGTAAAIVTANSVVIAVAQPLFGIFGDRKSLRWLALLGCALCGVMMVSITWLPSYWMIVVAAMLSGVGSAIFHPEGLAHARIVGGANKTQATSLFFLGGNIGFGLGPLLVTWLVATFGPHGAVGMIVPTLVSSLLLMTQTHKFTRAVAVKAPGSGAGLGLAPAVIGLVSFVLLLITLRSVTYEGIKVFAPLYLATEVGGSAKDYAPLQSAIALSGIVGTIIAGPLAARMGNRNLMVAAMAFASVMLGALLLTLTRTPLPVQLALAGLFGMAMTLPWTISVTMVQDAMPNNLGLAAGLTLGTAYGASGIGVGLLGRLADVFGLALTLQIIGALPVLVVLLSLLLPNARRAERAHASGKPAR
jgi:FSR family fosmidomycin resistance protein-like MFS transporter